MRFCFQGDDALHVFHDEIVARCLVGGCKLLHRWSLCKSHIIFIGRQNFVRMFFRRLFNHGKERRLHFFSVDDKCSAEYFVSAMFRIDLCEAEHLRVGQRPAQLLFDSMQIFYFLWREGESFLFVIGFNLLDIADRFWFMIHRKDLLSQSVVHPLQHLVVCHVFVIHWEIFLDAGYALHIHILSNLHSVRTPWCNHLASRTDEPTLYMVTFDKRRISIEPAEFRNLLMV